MRLLASVTIGASLLAIFPASAQVTPASPAFAQGAADRQGWEDWFNGLPAGQYRNGALFWSGQRSLRNPAGCYAQGGRDLGDWSAGCVAAQQRLTPSDARRKSEPDYRLGWNAPLPGTPVALAPPLIAPQQAPAHFEPSKPSNAPTTVSASSNDIIAQWSGSGMTTTRPFHAEGPFEVQWETTEYFSAYLDQVGGHQTLIANQNSAGSSYVPDGGNFYIKIEAMGDWHIRVVALPSEQVVPPPSVVVAIPQTPEASFRPMPATVAPHPVAPTTSDESSADQEGLIQVVQAAVRQYHDGQNDMQKGAARPMRAQAIARVVPSRRVHDWIGTVTELTTNGEGKGVLMIQSGPDTSVRTWNNALSDISDTTMIDPQSPLFQTVLQLHKGQKVRFSGTFMASQTDYIEECSMTLGGSITEPEFIMRFASIAPAE
jgi:hypothetical protein